MDYTIWGIVTAAIGSCCFWLGYCYAMHEPRHTRTGWQAPPIGETPPEEEDERSQLWRDLEDIIDRSQMRDW